MTDELHNDNTGLLGFDRLSHNRAAGILGGQARTPEKLAAVRANIAKARVVKDWYRRHPEDRPNRQPAVTTPEEG
jgi:hypothetical protein